MAIEETSSPAAQQSRRDEERGNNWQRTVPRKTLCDDDQAREGHQKVFLCTLRPFPYFPFYTRLTYSLLGRTGQA
jgi:hypothetical protein